MRGARFFHAVDLLALDAWERTVAFDHPCPCVAGAAAGSRYPLVVPAPPQNAPGGFGRL